MNPNDKKTLLRYSLITVAVVVIVTFTVLNLSKTPSNATPKDMVVSILEGGLDTSNSLYLQDEIDLKTKKINGDLQETKEKSNISIETVIDYANRAKDLRDYDIALALFDIADTMNPVDLFYKIEKGRIYLEREEWDQARQVFEPLIIPFPVHESYLGLIEAYKHIEGTPEYIIEGFYLESLAKNLNRFEVVASYVEWLEEKGREKETLPYYIIMHNQAPQPTLENKINELKQKYPDA